VIVASIITLLLAWFLAPLLATLFAKNMGLSPQLEMVKGLLVIALVLSTIFFFLGSLLSIKLAKSRPYIAAFAFTAIPDSQPSNSHYYK
jgi:predicted Na+-dependent transporter